MIDRRARRLALAVVGGLALAGCTASPTTPAPTETPMVAPPVEPDAAYSLDHIELIQTSKLTIGGTSYVVTAYENHDYRCGRTGDFPFVVLEPADANGERPLWVMLHGGGVGYFDDNGDYLGGVAHNDEETPEQLLSMARRFVGPDGHSDTFIGDRIRAGDRVVLGSLCDHDLMMGLGQPYPNDPYRADTVDGLLANLAMVDAVENGTGAVVRRPTTSTWVLGTSAGSYGAYALANNLWLRGQPPAGVIMDSGIFTSRSASVEALGIAGRAGMDETELQTKLGPYLTDSELWAENAVKAGFNVSIFDVVETGDKGCGGREPVLPEASAAGYATNCEWLHGALAEAIDAYGDPATQQVHFYPGTTHTATDVSGHPMQADLRAWYAAAVSLVA